MNNTCVILLLLLAFVSCTISSYLDIPPPPERPTRFKTKEQIEQYLKAVKDYYDAFKIKLVRRENEHFQHEYDSSDSIENFLDLYHRRQLLRNLLQHRHKQNTNNPLFK